MVEAITDFSEATDFKEFVQATDAFNRLVQTLKTKAGLGAAAMILEVQSAKLLNLLGEIECDEEEQAASPVLT